MSLDTAKRHLRAADFDDDNSYIGALVETARSWIDAPDGWLGRALIKQTLELRLDGFGGVRSSAEIDIPFPPLISVASVKYDDTDGTEQTLDPSLYRIIGGATARLVPAFRTFWPATRNQEESVRIRFDAGYGPAEADVPAAIRHAVLLLIGHFYENREAEIVGLRAAAIELPTGVDALLSPFRVYT